MRAGLSGRRAQAARNDRLILDAARAVFTADPDAPIAAVAQRAGVGISALYRRYRSKDELLQRLYADGLEGYIAAAEAALASQREPWQALAAFLRAVVAADTHALTAGLAGALEPTEELRQRNERARNLATELFRRAAAQIRPDVSPTDLDLILVQLAAVRVPDRRRTAQLRARYLALYLDALRSTAGDKLPGPAPRPEETASLRYLVPGSSRT